MSKPSFTPGPWQKFEDKLGNIRVGSANHSLAAVGNVVLHRQENEANARLIAAAPELLEALKVCRQALIESPSSTPYVAEIGLASAAIAKAEGRDE